MAEDIQHTEEKPEIHVNIENEETSMSNKEADVPLEEIPDEEKPEKLRKFKKWINGCFDKKQVASMLLTVFLTFLIGWILPKIIEHFKCGNRAYIAFEADFTQVFRLSKEVPNLEYIAGEDLWKENWKKVGTESIVFGGNRGKLLLRGQNIYGTNKSIISFATDAQVICTGDIRTLIDYKHYKFVDTSKARFSSLFYNCTQLVVAPELPATKLADECYRGMFSGCTSLKTAPELPATELAKRCYYAMFFGCTSLITAPKLPAMELDTSCYSSMFGNCTSLRSSSILPATKLAYYCYSSMFYGCTSLEIAPILPPSKILPEGCCHHMFYGCTSLSLITMFAADIPNIDCFNEWLDNTSTNGDFFKNEKATWDNEGIVPEGWEVWLFDSANILKFVDSSW